MVGGKDAGTESRFKQWTMMEGLSSVASQDANIHKNGEKGDWLFREFPCSIIMPEVKIAQKKLCFKLVNILPHCYVSVKLFLFVLIYHPHKDHNLF